MASDEKKKRIKTFFMLIDGIGDLGIKKLGDLTPLQYASIPIFDAMAKSGVNGIMDPVETGLACGSDTAHMNIFGYNPFTEYRGRGCFETMGSGIPMDFNEIGFKCNFAHLDPGSRIVKLRRVDREFDKWGLPLIDLLNGMEIPGYQGYKITVVHATEHRCGLKVSGLNLSSAIGGTDPLKDNLKLRKVEPTHMSEKSAFTADLINALNEAIIEALIKHPLNLERERNGLPTANVVLLRGCGSRLEVKNFKESQGLKAFMIAPTAIINGLGQCIDIDIIKVKGATGYYDSDFIAKADAALENLLNEEKNYDYGFFHIKAVDDAGHDKSLDKKIKFTEKANEAMGHFIKKFNEKGPRPVIKFELVLALTGDHTTPIKVGDHTFEPVPFTVTTHSAVCSELGLATSEKAGLEKLLELRDSVVRFDEISACQGILGRFSGAEVQGIFRRFRNLVSELINKE